MVAGCGAATQLGKGFTEPAWFQRTQKARWDGTTRRVTAIGFRSSVDALDPLGNRQPSGKEVSKYYEVKTLTDRFIPAAGLVEILLH